LSLRYKYISHDTTEFIILRSTKPSTVSILLFSAPGPSSYHLVSLVVVYKNPMPS